MNNNLVINIVLLSIMILYSIFEIKTINMITKNSNILQSVFLAFLK